MAGEPTRDLLKDFTSEMDMTTKTRVHCSEPKTTNGEETPDLQPNQEPPRSEALSDPVIVRLQQIFSQAVTPLTHEASVVTSATILNTLSAYGLTVVPTNQLVSPQAKSRPTATPFITTVKKTRPGLGEQKGPQNRKQILGKGYKSA